MSVHHGQSITRESEVLSLTPEPERVRAALGDSRAWYGHDGRTLLRWRVRHRREQLESCLEKVRVWNKEQRRAGAGTVLSDGDPRFTLGPHGTLRGKGVPRKYLVQGLPYMELQITWCQCIPVTWCQCMIHRIVKCRDISKIKRFRKR